MTYRYTAAEAATNFKSLIVLELCFVASFLISPNHNHRVLLSIQIKIDMEHKNNHYDDKVDSLFEFTLVEDILKSRNKLNRLIESVGLRSHLC